MKKICSVILFLFAFNTYAQNTWPYNASGKNIEFKGRILWPTKIKTPDQRLFLVRQWFLKKMTDAKKDELTSWIMDEKIPINYGSIPGETYLDYKKGGELFRIVFNVQLKTNKAGMTYHLSNFEYVWGGEDVSTSCSLEAAVVSSTTNHAAINILKKRLESSLRNW
jgi:hypothetical protein